MAIIQPPFLEEKQKSPIITDRALVREPNLWVPGEKPIGIVKWIGPDIDAFTLFHGNNFSGFSNLPVNATVVTGDNKYRTIVLSSRIYDSGIQYDPRGLAFYGGPSNAHNYTYFDYTPGIASPFPSKTWLMCGMVISNLTSASAPYNSPVLINSGSYNRIYLKPNAVIFNIGNTTSTVPVDPFTPSTKKLIIIVFLDQTGSSRNSHVFINGKHYYSLGTTKDTTHDQNEGVSLMQSARSNNAWHYILESHWFSTKRNMTISDMKEMSKDPYQFLVPA